MKCKCPNCYATGSLEMFTSDEASQAFASVLNLTGELAKPLIKYLGLFRSENRDLSFSRTAKLINEIAPDIVAGQIQRNRQTYPAPKKAWIWAINIMLERREQGLLQLPLKTHGYLYEVISSYKPEDSVKYQPEQTTVTRPVVTEPSMYERMQHKSEQQHHEQQLREHEQHKNAKPAFNLGEMMSYARVLREHPERKLKGFDDPASLLAHLQQNCKDNETLDDCYQRLKALEIETQETETQL